MIERFEGESGKRLTIDALSSQKLVASNRELAELLAECVELRFVRPGDVIIRQGDDDDDVYLILSGVVNILANGRVVGKRMANDHIGEMAAIDPSSKRSATAIVSEDGVIAKLTEADFTECAHRHPEIYLYLARELSKRLLQRNVLVNMTREKIRVFIISSVEALPVARSIQDAFAHDSFITTIWTDGVFKATNYPLQSLEDEIDYSDFAIAVAHADDPTESSDGNWPASRNNVIFELGLFMGRLGRQRAILMEPRDEGVNPSSALAGITTIPYRYEAGGDTAALMAPACNRLREHILRLGPNH